MKHEVNFYNLLIYTTPIFLLYNSINLDCSTLLCKKTLDKHNYYKHLVT